MSDPCLKNDEYKVCSALVLSHGHCLAFNLPSPLYWSVSRVGVTLSGGWLYQKWRSLDIPGAYKPSLNNVVFKINDEHYHCYCIFSNINITRNKNKNNVTTVHLSCALILTTNDGHDHWYHHHHHQHHYWLSSLHSAPSSRQVTFI